MNKEAARALVRSGNFSIISGEHITRNGKPYTLAESLADGWYAPLATYGTWEGETESSWLIPNCHAPAACHYGRIFNQTCVIADNAMWYMNGQMVPLDCGATLFSDTPLERMDYTMLVCDDGVLYFHIPPMIGETPKARMALYKARLQALAPNVPL